jgi:hypothetical protein
VSLDANSRIREGESTRLFMNIGGMHLFDPATGKNLTLSSPSSSSSADSSTSAD